jgi:hypothetical protein
MVIDRSNRVARLQTSPYASKLDVCHVFLDEAHTRGIDLRLPAHYRAAVTLGAGLDKNRLTQACMRMRKLGSGQTVMFCITEEIEGRIRACSPRVSHELTVSDVLRWAILETHAEMKRSIPLWAM